MLKRYTTKEMEKNWSEINKKQQLLNVEAAILKAQEELDNIPKGISKKLVKVKVTKRILKRADELEKITDHDFFAFLLSVIEKVGDEVRPYLHTGCTTFDIQDTALALIMIKSIDLITTSLLQFKTVLSAKAGEHKNTIMIGRTHFIHAEPITFGYKLLNWLWDIEEHIKELHGLKKKVAIGKMSGAVGVYSLDPKVEELACEFLDLRPAKISTQVLPRRIHVKYIVTLVAAANSLDRFATEIKHLAGTDIGEVAEYKKPGAKGSSAMPGKSRLRNPIKSENTSGLAKAMRGYLIPAHECEILWNERSLDNSAPERIHLPDASILLDFMIQRFTATIEKLEVYPRQMKKNLGKTGGIIYAQRIMMALAEKGMNREDAYNLLEELALSTEPGTFKDKDGKTFRQLVFSNPKIKSLLKETEIRKCFNPKQSLKNINEVFARFGL